MRRPAAFLAATALACQAQSWRSVYFYDEDRSSLQIHDLHWPGPGCIAAVGGVAESGKVRPVTLVSRDEGLTWTLSRHKRWIRAAFFVNPRIGWLLTESGLERTGDCGITAEPAGSQTRDFARVCFQDESLGWGVGPKDKAAVTSDGGRHWEDLRWERPPKGAEGTFSSHRDPGLFVTDAASLQDGWIYLAGVDEPGSVRLPPPTRVRMLRSRDGKFWQAMKVDYRAEARYVTLAASPQGGVAAATDTGMILSLEG